VASPRLRRIAWLLPAVLAVHVAEEAAGFAAWARRNTWQGYRDRDFVLINATGVALTAGATLVATRTTNRAAFAAYHVALLSAQALWNPVFHAATTLAYREYSPGLVSAVAVFPATWALITKAAIDDGRLTCRGALLSAALGAPVHAATVAQQVYGIGARR
jgi:hypothetical protein